MADVMKLRGGSAVRWTTVNPILYEREVGLETDTRKFKVGDGVSAWTQLEYWGGGAAISDADFLTQGVRAGLLQQDLADVDLVKLADKVNDSKVLQPITTDLAGKTEEADFQVVKIEVERLKTDISAGQLETYVWRGIGTPVVNSSKPYKAYFLHLINVANDTTIINIPLNTPDGAIFSVENNDRNNYVTLVPPQGQTINGLAASYRCDFDTLNFFVKSGTNWVLAYGGIFPNNMDALKSTIRVLFPNNLFTIAEVQAQLKDRLHTFREIQNEFSTQLHTFDAIEANMITKGFSKGFSVGYGTLDTDTPSQDLNWVQVHFAPNAEVVIPASNEGMKYLAIYMPIFFGALVNKVEINQAEEEYSERKIVANELEYTVFVLTNKVDTSTTNRLNLSFHASDTIPGVNFDDGTEDVGAVTRVNLKGGLKITKSDTPNEIDLTADGGTGWIETDTDTNFVPTAIKSQDKVVEIHKAGNGDAVVNIKPGYFELAKAPGYLAYLNEEEQVIGRLKPGETGVHVGKLWFGDVVVNGGEFISTDRANKSITLEDYTGDDPSVTGGVPHLVIIRIAMKGTAVADGYVEVMLRSVNKGTQTQNGNIIVDNNNNPMAMRKNYKSGENLNYLELAGIYMAKESVEMEIEIEHTFVDDGILIEDRTEGISGVMIQALGADSKTGSALLQFENDTMQNIEFTSHYLGDNIFDISYALKYDEPSTEFNVGVGQTSVDGLHFYNNTKIKAIINNNTMGLEDNGIDPCYFSLGKIFSHEKTVLLRTKQVNASVNVWTKLNAFKIMLVKWIGDSDQYTKKIITGIQGTQETFEAGWSKVNEVEIQQDTINALHPINVQFTVPDNAKNFAVIITPTAMQIPVKFDIDKFTVSVTPFSAYILDVPELVGEKHLEFSEMHKSLIVSASGLGVESSRYTLNNTPITGIPMPVGSPKSGLADIEIDHTINNVTNSIIEGAIKFNAEGKATITTALYVWSEKAQGVLAATKFWYSKVSTDGTVFTKIPESELDVSIQGSTKAVNTMPTFSIDVQPNDRIALFAITDQVDGCYLFTKLGDPNPMVKTVIDFDEITASERDVLNKLILLDAELVITKDAIDAGCYIELDFKAGKPALTAKQR